MTVNYPLTFFLLFLGPVAQGAPTGNPGFMSPGTPGMEAGKPDPGHYNFNDVLFLQEAAKGNHGEVELARLAKNRAQDERVGKFATMMIDDHSHANGQLMAIRDDLKMERPELNDAEHEAEQAAVKTHADPDRQYMATEVAEHQKTANLLLWELSTGQNDKLLGYARQTLPAVLMHLETAKGIQASLGDNGGK